MAYKRGTFITPMKNSLQKYALVLSIGALFGVFFYSYLHFSETGRFPSIENSEGILLSLIGGCALSLTLFFVNKLIDRRLPWNKKFTLRFFVGYLADFIIAVCMLQLLSWIFSFTGRRTTWQGLNLNDDDLVSKTMILLILIIFIYKIFYALVYSYNQYTVAQIDTIKNERRHLELQFQALKSQVSPHYLFNSLNTISSLMVKDLPSAEQFIRRLAQTYQYVLQNQDKKYVSVEEEVEFVKSYYYLLRIRFQQQLDVEINIPANIMKTKIPPLTLQMLVENAVKHNSMRSDKKLFIYITAQDNTYLRIINNKTNTVDLVESFKVGLENIRKRYEYFTDTSILVTNEEKFSVSLPVLHSVRDEQKFSA
jgi:two-component system, LytTR family, sensor kinase